MNLTKYTKAELIGKLKSQKENIKNHPNWFTNILGYLLLIKSFLLYIRVCTRWTDQYTC